MKKIHSILMVAVAALSMSFTANAEAPKWEVVAGMNVANVDASGCSSRIGFHAGIRTTIGIPSVSKGFYGNAGALLSLKGTKAAGITFNPYYLDIPLYILVTNMPLTRLLPCSVSLVLISVLAYLVRPMAMTSLATRWATSVLILVWVCVLVWNSTRRCLFLLDTTLVFLMWLMKFQPRHGI